jgi:hypothetical protein
MTWIAQTETESIRRSVRFNVVGPKVAQSRRKRQTIEIVLAGQTSPKSALEPRLRGTGTRIVATADDDRTFDLVASGARNVGVVVVDVDRFGIRFVSDLRAVFPSLGMVAVSREPRLRALSLRSGAAGAVPRSAGAKRVAREIVALARRF